MSVICIHCNERIKPYYEGICNSCRYDSKIMISQSDAKRKYKLDDDDLDTKELFSIMFKMHSRWCTKYLRTQIDDLAYEITKDLDVGDKRKVAYEKNHHISEEVKKDKENWIERNKLIIKMLDGLIKKFNYPYCIKQDDYVLNIINQYAKQSDLSIFEASHKILPTIEKRIELLREEDKRRERLDILIKDRINENDINDANNHPYYKRYIKYGNLDINKYIQKIERDIQKNKDMTLKRDKLDLWTENNIDPSFIKEIEESEIYSKFIKSGSIKRFNKTTELLKDYESELKNKCAKKNEIKNELLKHNKNINDDNIYYQQYINTNDITLDYAVNQIIKDLDKKSRKDKAIKYLNENYKNNYKGLIVHRDFHNDYINKGSVEFDQYKEQVDILTKRFREWENICQSLSRHNKISQEKLKFKALKRQFYDGSIECEQAKNIMQQKINEMVLSNNSLVR